MRFRYADAAYFYRQDTAKPLADYTPSLGTLTFHAKLGSMLDKVNRLTELAPTLAGMLAADAATVAAALMPQNCASRTWSPTWWWR
ncbi:MAG: glycine--tRNA ligase subunit beta [Caldilineaceae bacterium]